MAGEFLLPPSFLPSLILPLIHSPLVIHSSSRHSFIHSPIHAHTHTFPILSFIHPSRYSFIHSSTHASPIYLSFILHAFIYSVPNSHPHSFIHPSTHSFPILSFIRPSRYSFVHSSTHPFPIFYSFIPQFTSTFILFLILSFIHPSNYAFIPPLIHSSHSRSSIHSIIHSPLQPSVHSYLHSFIPPVIHSSAADQRLFCAEPSARCWAPLVNKVDPELGYSSLKGVGGQTFSCLPFLIIFKSECEIKHN